jgi:hypothetical protein
MALVQAIVYVYHRLYTHYEEWKVVPYHKRVDTIMTRFPGISITHACELAKYNTDGEFKRIYRFLFLGDLEPIIC